MERIEVDGALLQKVAPAHPSHHLLELGLGDFLEALALLHVACFVSE